MQTAHAGGAGLDTPSELAARLTVARSSLAPQVPCAVWQAAYVRIGRYLDALGIDPAAHEALIRKVLADAAGSSETDFISVALAALQRRLDGGETESQPITTVASSPPMPAIERSHMRPLPLRRRQLRDVWDRHLEPVAIAMLRVIENFYRTLRLLTS